MEIKRFFAVMTISIIFSGLSYAQDGDLGNDPESCRINLSTYTEFFNQGNLKDAMTAWRWCFNNCPASTRNIYINGVNIMEYYIENAEDEETKQAYIDTLMMVYDNRIKYFGQEGMVLGRKGITFLKHRPQEIVQAYEIFEKAFNVGGKDTEFNVLGYYYNLAIILFTHDMLDAERVVELYSEISDVLNEQIENAEDENRKSRIKEVLDRVEELFVKSGAADCIAIIKLFGPQLDAKPGDVDLARKIVNLLDQGEGDECQSDELYMKAAVIVYNNEKTARAAHSLAQYFFKRNMPQDAEKYYNEAIEMEEDNQSKADMYYELALLYFNQMNQYQRARNTAKSAIANNPNHGRAYILIGRAYAAGGTGCGETTLEKKALWWVVVDQFVKARNVDSSVTSQANELINRYSQYFPTQEEIFWENYEVGQSFTVGCWINETTTIRASD
jgi:tetratricopeptide (TPR) repeat protein